MIQIDERSFIMLFYRSLDEKKRKNKNKKQWIIKTQANSEKKKDQDHHSNSTFSSLSNGANDFGTQTEEHSL